MNNAAVTTYTLNAIGQRLGVTNTNSAGTILSQFGHTTNADSMLGYDGEGKLMKLKSIIAANATLGGTTNYSYDSKNQLTGESSTRAGTVSNTFNYDRVGNPTTWQLNVAGQTNQNTVRTFNANNQETTLNSGGQVQFVYDGNGNPTNYKGVATTYDVANHLTSFGTQLTAGYRSDGKRAWKQNSAGVRAYFLYDGDALLCELDGNGNVTYTNTWGANGLVSRRDAAASSTRFYTWDNGGSVAQRLDASGNVIDSFTFTAFGQKVGSGGDPYTGYNGQWGYYTDYETGLILCTHRYYDPSSGRWLTRDPIGYDGGLNLYAYVGGNPINVTDSSGLIAYPRTPRQIAESDAWDQGFASGLNDIGRNIASGLDEVMVFYGSHPPADWQQAQQIEKISESVRYVAVNGSYTLPNGVGYGGQVVYDCFGNRYWGHGPSGGGAGPSFSFVVGFMDTPARQDQLFDFLNENSQNWTVGNWGVVGGITKSGDQRAYELGLGNPQYSVNLMYDRNNKGPGRGK